MSATVLLLGATGRTGRPPALWAEWKSRSPVIVDVKTR